MPVHAAPPVVNLTVAWRLEDASQRQDTRQVVQGQVIVDTRGQVIGRTGLGASTVSTERQQHSEQSLRVLNGQQARLFVGRQVARQSWQLVMSAQGTQGVQSQTQWLDLGDGLVVRPRWPGGRQPVSLDVEARSSRALAPGQAQTSGFDPDGQVSRTELATTLALPLGQWTLLARSGSGLDAQSRQRGTTLSTRSLDEQGNMALWVRVSTDAPTDPLSPAP
ncbi:MAG: hypothetical protein RI907_3413 [Pseudomonadota bacterium]|jgi:hypothetical protein